MITLFGFGRGFGLADPSPFVVKAEVLLKLAGLDYVRKKGDPRKAPKGKLPYITDGTTTVADSTLIRLHIEKTRGFDFDKGLSDQQKGIAWSIEKMLEDHVYWLIVHERWQDGDNFERGPRTYFDEIPRPLRPLIIGMVRRQVRGQLHGQGIGRYTAEERIAFGRRAAEALSRCLGDKPWLMGDAPSGADAAAYALVSSSLCPLFQGPLRNAFASHANLVAYAERGTNRWFPELAATPTT